MMFKLCPACRYVNDADATRCEDCGAPLGPGDAVGPAAATATGAIAEAAPPLVALTLRDMLAPPPANTAPRDGAAAGGSAPHRAEPSPAFPPLDEQWLAADPPPAPSASPAPEDPQARTALAEARAARRAAVRRARLQASAADTGHFVPEVLVLDRDAVARDTLSGLLRLFGFGVIGVADAGRATLLLTERPFTAVFADIALDGADGGIGIEFCRHLREGAAPKVLVLVSEPLNAVDRVRAQLLGFDGMLPKPARRGDVAGVLDARGVALPCDARRH